MKRGIALFCMLALLFCMIPASAPEVEAAAPSEKMYVGYGLKNVTPQMSVPLAGYAKTEKRMSEYNPNDVKNSHLLDDNGDGVVDSNDGVYAACVAVKDSDGEILIFFGMDLIGANSGWVNKARAAIVETLANQGITVKASNIMVTVSHTHSSPDMSSSQNIIDTYRDTILVPGMVEAAQQAVADFKPVTDISKVVVKTENINFIRHYEHSNTPDFETIVGYDGDNSSTGANGSYTRPTSQADSNIYMLKFERDGGQPVVMANWTAHPKCNSTGETAWGKINRLKVSADYVGTFRADLAKAGYLVAFYQGAAGNTNTFSKLNHYNKRYADPTNPATKQYVSGVNKNENDKGGTISGTCQTSVLYGRLLANYAKEGLGASSNTDTVTIESLRGGKIDAQQRMFSATVDRGDPAAYEAIMAVDPATNKTYYDILYSKWNSSHAVVKQFDIKSIYHLSAIKRRNELAFDAYQLEINAIRIGEDISIVTAPNELFDTYCHDLRDQGTFIFGYSNNSMGYLPDVVGIEKYFCYEANTTNYVAGTGEALVKTLQEMMMTPEELGLSTTCHLCGAKNVQWKILGGTSNKNVYSEGIDITQVTSGHYYMIHDLYGNKNVSNGTWQKTFVGNVCLDMRGHTIGNTSGVTGRAILVAQNAKLNIANGTLIGRGMNKAGDSDGGVVSLLKNATLNATNMTIRREVNAKQSINNGGVVYMNAGTKLNLYNSTVSGGQALTQGGGIYVPATGVLTIGGNTHIIGNTLADGTQNNIYLEKSSLAGGNFRLLPDYAGGVKVTLPAETGSANFGVYEHAAPSGYVGSDASDNKFATYAGGYISMGNACPYCGEENVTWQEFPASGSGTVLDIPAGHYYLADDRTGTQNYRRRITGDVCLNMNGHIFANASVTTGTAFYVIDGSTFNVFGGGTIRGQGYKTANNGVDSLYQGGVIRVDKGAKANLYGITVQRVVNSGQSAKWGGVLYTAGDLLLYGTRVCDGVATIQGDGVYVAGTGSLTLAGNTVVAENIYLAGKIHVSENYNGSATLELPTYENGAVLGTCGAYTGQLSLSAENAFCWGVGGNLTVKLQEDVCQIVYAEGTESIKYDSLREALEVYFYSDANPAYIRLLDNISGVTTVNETVYLDTNGYDVSVKIAENGAVFGMECGTNDYTVTYDELGTVTAIGGRVEPGAKITIGGEVYTYLTLTDSDGVSTFHRYAMDTKAGLRAYSESYGTALYFQPVFYIDAVAETAVDYGVVLMADKPDAEPITVSVRDAGRVTGDVTRIVVPQLMPTDEELAAGTKNLQTHDLSQMPVACQGYIRTADGTFYEGTPACTTLFDAVQKADAAYSSLNQSQKAGLAVMVQQYGQSISPWELKNIH